MVDQHVGESPADEAGREIRATVARELHDRVAQTLTAMLVEMENFKSGQYGRVGVIREVDTYQDATRDVLNNLRSVLFDLRGDTEGGRQFLGRLTGAVKRFQERSGIRATIRVSRRWPQEIAVQAAPHLERIVDEALNNVWLHSGAQRVSVDLQTTDDERAILKVRDDGSGVRPSWSGGSGLGLIGMRERALLLGGDLRVLTARPRGTLVVASFPWRNLL